MHTVDEYLNPFARDIKAERCKKLKPKKIEGE